MFFHSTPINKRNVSSTPNLSMVSPTDTTIYHAQLNDSTLHTASSTHSVPRKSSLIDKSAEEIRKAPSTGSSKGVHFCEVVAEVSWRDSSSESNVSSNVSISSEDENQVAEEEEEKSSAEGGAEEEQSEHVVITNWPSAESEPNTDEASRSETNDSVGGSNGRCLAQEPVGVMESGATDGRNRPRRAARFGNFLSRFANFRFSARRREKNKENKVNNHQEKIVLPPAAALPLSGATEYTYIPLKGPLPLEKSCPPVEGCVSSKPPLPRAPPPCRQGARASGVDKRRALAPNIDREQRESGAVCRSVGSRNACSMEPMGLIETDLDTEVTVITSGAAAVTGNGAAAAAGAGAHAKTRSLMNLGAAGERQPQRLHQHTNEQNPRPHKSMEFLLDKENLKAVQVSSIAMPY